MYGAMILVILELLSGGFTAENLIRYSVIVAVTFLVRCVFTAVNYVQTQYRGADITETLRLSLGDHIRRLNLGYFNTNSIGRLVSTLTTDIADFEVVLTHSLATFFKIVFFSAMALAFSFSVDWRFALVVSALILLSLPLLGRSGKVAQTRGEALRHAMHEVISRVVEYLNGITTFRLYHLTGERFARLDNSFQDLRRASIRMEFSVMPYAIGFSTLTSWIVPLALVVGTLLLNEGLDARGLIALIMAALALSSMMMSLCTLYPEMAFLNRAGESIISAMDEKPLGGMKSTVAFSHHDIAFDEVRFGYIEGTDVLDGISFVAKAGTTTALIGPSGGGKTTCVSLIPRFWDVTGGRITIGDEDIRDITPDGLTQHMAMVFQDVYLLNDSIENNIKVGKPNATRDEVVAAARAACCHDFITALPDGYQALVGEGGNTLSGGEKQRISLARALIRDAPIVILDETTSSLDADNEREIGHALDTLMREKTVMVIAHRLHTIQRADTILVLDKGRIVEQGNHETLMRNDGWYAHMIEEQRQAQDWTV
jgi:ATP-binding cassette subfamily B protein